MRTLFFIFILALASQAQAAVKYVPPNDSQPLLRRDLIPLDVDAIRELAEHLAILADGSPPRSASMLRNRVQTLTLSQRLSPTQARARAIMEALATGEERPNPEKQKSKSAKRSILADTSWLIKLPADSEGHHLGQLLLDILQPHSNNSEIFALHDAQKAPERWKGVVAKVTAFEKKEKTKPKPQKIKNQGDMPAPDEPTPEGPGYAVTALLTEVPMISGDLPKKHPPSYGLIKISLVITQSKNEANGNDGELRIKPNTPYSTRALELTLKNFFRSQNQNLPKGYNLNVNTDNRRYLTINRENIVAPLAMMLDAAISGRPLRRNTIFFAKLDSSGSLTKPAQAWSLLLDLEALRVPEGTRIIVGSGMLEEMTALLVFEKATFFTKYEVIEAPSFKLARELFYQDGRPNADLATAISGYQEVREKANLATNFNTFFSLATVESRLVKARDKSPQHISASMLAAQAIRRPAYLTRFMFAQELDRRLKTISQLKPTNGKIAERTIKAAYKEARKSIDPLERLIERSERLILDNAVDLLKKLNSAGRVGSSSYDFEKTIQRVKDLAVFQQELTSFRKKLRQIYQPTKTQ